MGKTERLSQLVTSKKKLEIRKQVTSYKLTSLEIRDRALLLAGDLASVQEPNNMTAYYCKAFRILGEGRYLAVVSACRDRSIRNPMHLFNYLLREEMEAITRRKVAS